MMQSFLDHGPRRDLFCFVKISKAIAVEGQRATFAGQTSPYETCH